MPNATGITNGLGLIKVPSSSEVTVTVSVPGAAYGGKVLRDIDAGRNTVGIVSVWCRLFEVGEVVNLNGSKSFMLWLCLWPGVAPFCVDCVACLNGGINRGAAEALAGASVIFFGF